MPLDQSTILSGPDARPQGGELLVTWESSAPDGSIFQLFVDSHLVYVGPARSTHLPIPEGTVHLQVGVVPADEAEADHAAELPDPPGGGGRARLEWAGGLFQTPEIVGFHVYMGTAPGGAVDYTEPVATVPARFAGLIEDGYGVGGYGAGGYGSAAGTYRWTSRMLAAGTWNFAVKAYDRAGIESSAVTVSQLVSGPPNPPARFADGRRLHVSYSAGTGVATLTWQAPES